MRLAVEEPSPSAIIEALAKRNGNVTRAARDLDMLASDLRRLVRDRPVLKDLAFEMVEQKLDLAEQAIFDGLTSQRMAERLDAADMMLRSRQARQRGWNLGRVSEAPTEAAPKPEIKWVEK